MSVFTAIVVPAATVVGVIASIIWNIHAHHESRKEAEATAREVAVTAAEERGRMEERQVTMERQIDAAHDKIRDLDSRQDEANTKMAELSNDVKHILKSVDTLVAIHTRKE